MTTSPAGGRAPLIRVIPIGCFMAFIGFFSGHGRC